MLQGSRTLLLKCDFTSRYLQIVPDSKHRLIQEGVLNMRKECCLYNKVSVFAKNTNSFEENNSHVLYNKQLALARGIRFPFHTSFWAHLVAVSWDT